MIHIIVVKKVVRSRSILSCHRKDAYQLCYSHKFSDCRVKYLHGCLASVYGLKPEVCVRVVPDSRAELQVDPARGPQAAGPRAGSTRSSAQGSGPTLTQTKGFNPI